MFEYYSILIAAVGGQLLIVGHLRAALVLAVVDTGLLLLFVGNNKVLNSLSLAVDTFQHEAVGSNQMKARQQKDPYYSWPSFETEL